jgi:hypothetical protein
MLGLLAAADSAGRVSVTVASTDGNNAPELGSGMFSSGPVPVLGPGASNVPRDGGDDSNVCLPLDVASLSCITTIVHIVLRTLSPNSVLNSSVIKIKGK